jgi:NADH-quinone oxidoreductase subunit L
LIILAVLSIVGGYVGIPAFIKEGAHSLSDFLQPVFAGSLSRMEPHHIAHSTEWMLTGISTALILAIVVFAWNKFSRKPDIADAAGFGKVLENKWYVDELYEKIVVKPLEKLGGFFNRVMESAVIDGMVNGVGRLVNYGGRQLRLLQTGQVGTYILLMVLGMLLIFALQFFLRK